MVLCPAAFDNMSRPGPSSRRKHQTMPYTAVDMMAQYLVDEKNPMTVLSLAGSHGMRFGRPLAPATRKAESGLHDSTSFCWAPFVTYSHFSSYSTPIYKKVVKRVSDGLPLPRTQPCHHLKTVTPSQIFIPEHRQGSSTQNRTQIAMPQ